jgi:hypothetical protein
MNKDNPVKRKRGRPRKQELTTIGVRADALSGFNGNSIVIAEALKDDLPKPIVLMNAHEKWKNPMNLNFGPLADFEEPEEVKKEKARHKRFQQEQQEIHMALLAWARGEEAKRMFAKDIEEWLDQGDYELSSGRENKFKSKPWFKRKEEIRQREEAMKRYQKRWAKEV